MFVCPKSFHIHVQFVFYFSVRSYTWPNRIGLDRLEILVTVIARGSESESEFGLTRSRVPGRQGLSSFGGRPRAECPSRHGCCHAIILFYPLTDISYDRYGRGILLGRRFAAALLPRLFGTNPRSHHKGALLVLSTPAIGSLLRYAIQTPLQAELKVRNSNSSAVSLLRRNSLSNSPCPLGRARGRGRYNLLARAIKNKPFQCSNGRDSPQRRRTAARVEQGDFFKFYAGLNWKLDPLRSSSSSVAGGVRWPFCSQFESLIVGKASYHAAGRCVFLLGIM